MGLRTLLKHTNATFKGIFSDMIMLIIFLVPQRHSGDFVLFSKETIGFKQFI